MMRSTFTSGAPSIRPVLAWAVCAGLITAAIAGGGCQQRPPEGQTTAAQTEMPAPGPVKDPLAMAAAIDDSGKVTPGTIRLSKAAGDRVQWMNTSHDTMLIILKDSHVAELVAPGQFSASHRVCIDCMIGNYPYVIKRMVAGSPENPQPGPPTEPQVGVGD